MLKLGIITDEVSQDFETAAKLGAKYNVSALEIRSVWDKGPHELLEDDITKIIEISKKYNMVIPCISSPFFKANLYNKEEYNIQIDILKKCINLAKKVGAKYIRGFTFWKKGNFFDIKDDIKKAFKKPIELLKENNLIMVLEFDPSVNADNATKLKEIIEHINSPSIMALWDPGNLIFSDPIEEPFPYGYNIIKPFIKHIHLKDAIINDGKKAEAVKIGTGLVSFKDHFKALIEDNYDGYIVLETHYRIKAKISSALMELPKGEAFSYMGYEASEECLQNIQKIFHEIRQEKKID